MLSTLYDISIGTTESEVSISLSGGEREAYSTRSTLKGHLNLNFRRETRIHEISLTFDGVTSTAVQNQADNGPARGRATAKHTFLKLQYPVTLDALPENALAKAGTRYAVPFNFVIPDKILPHTCSHPVTSTNVKEAHLFLPPSLNGPSDFAPEEVKIVYNIHAQIACQSTESDAVEAIYKSVEVRVVPARDEEPPLTVCEGQNEYSLRKEKSLKFGLMKKKGQLVVETLQPRSFDLLRKKSAALVSTTMTLKLRYDPVNDEDQPPQLSNVTIKLRVFTIFGAIPFEEFAQPGPSIEKSYVHDIHSTSIELSSPNLSSVEWQRYEYGLKSTANDASIAAASSVYKPGAPFYAASVSVAIILPSHYGMSESVRIVPSFQSCLVSRSYAVDISTSFHAATSKIGSSVVLTVPAQVTAQGNVESGHVPPLDDATVAEIDRVFSIHHDEQMSPNHDDEQQSATETATTSVAAAEGLPTYTSGSHAADAQAEGIQVNRQSVSTSYEVKPQEWQNIGTGIKWVYRKLQQRKDRQGE